jgi:hypothetical protein
MVVITKRLERSMWVNGLLALIPDAVIAWIAAWYTDSGVLGFIGVMLGLQCLYFLIWAKNSLWMWLMYWVSGRRKMSAFMEDYLVQNRFPAPPEYVSDIDDYLGRIANGEQYDCQTRVKAAVEIGTLAGCVSLARRIQFGLQLRLAFEDALVRYARRFPPPATRDDE